MAVDSNRLNVVGAVALVALAIGAIWYTTEDDKEDGIVALIWIAVALFTVQYFWNLFAFGEPALGEEYRNNALLAKGAAGGDDAALAARVAELEAENARLRKTGAAGAGAGAVAGAAGAAALVGGKSKREEELEKEVAATQSRVEALKTEMGSHDERAAERELAFKKNIAELQGTIGELKNDTEQRTATVGAAKEKMKGLKPYIGIMIEDLPKKMRKTQNGVRIQTVKPNTPAEGAGFKKGDIIERMNSVDMLSSEDVMGNLVQRKPGDICSFIVKRGDEYVNVVMEVGHKELTTEEVHRIRRLASGLIRAEDLEEQD